ncbi:MAG TPA: hypothetical protein V6D14_06650 [Coleofasciculaceae cyanobacterium]
MSADVCEDGYPTSQFRRVICVVGILRPNLVAGSTAGQPARICGSRNRLQHSARRQTSGLFKLPLGQ